MALSLCATAVYAGGVRVHGLLDDPAEVGRGGHVCWSYDDDASFAEAARRFLADGAARGDRLLCVAGERVLDAVRTAVGAGGDGPGPRSTITFLPVSGAY